MARLLLGPLLRHVGERDATIWVETDAQCEVQVRTIAIEPPGEPSTKGNTPTGTTASARTFTVAGHHYALVVIEQLQAKSSTPYEVFLDDELVWPEADSPFPPSRIRTVDPDRPIRILFGSCREPPTVRPNDRPRLFSSSWNRVMSRSSFEKPWKKWNIAE